MSVRTITVTLTEAEADNLWMLADLAGEFPNVTKVMAHSSYMSGRRAMQKLADANYPEEEA